MVEVIDEDLGMSGSGASPRAGFERLTAEVALSRVGLVLGLEVSRLARNNADWYQLLDLAGMTDTLIGDSDGLYHPASFNDRLVLGLKGTMSEAELHVLRARLEGGIRNTALVNCASTPSAPISSRPSASSLAITWSTKSSGTTAPAAGPADAVEIPEGSAVGSFTFVMSDIVMSGFLSVRDPPYTDLLTGPRRTDLGDTHLHVGPPCAHPSFLRWRLCLWSHPPRTPPRRPRCAAHPRPPVGPRRLAGADHGPPSWLHRLGHLRNQPGAHRLQHQTPRAPARQRRPARGQRPAARPGHLRTLRASTGRALPGRQRHPGYHCANRTLVNGHGERCLSVGGVQIDHGVTGAFLAALAPAGVAAALAAAETIEADHDAALAQWRRQVERARYQAARVERRYLAVDPDNRLVHAASKPTGKPN